MGQFYEELGQELSVYVRQIAWLLAIPRSKDASGKETKLPARIEAYKAQETEPPLPPLTARHVYNWLMEIGPVEPAGMGQAPIGWATIRAWAESTFARPSAWEARQLRRLSAEYLSESQAAEDHMRPPPWLPRRTVAERQTDEQRLRAVLG